MTCCLGDFDCPVLLLTGGTVENGADNTQLSTEKNLFLPLL